MPYDPFVVDGTQLKIKIGSTFTTIPGVQSFSGPDGSKTNIETTAIDDTAKKFKSGKPDYGSVKIKLAWDPAEATHQKLLTSFNTAGSTDDLQAVCSDAGAATIDFSGGVDGWGWTFDKDNVAFVDVSVKLSGPATVTP